MTNENNNSSNHETESKLVKKVEFIIGGIGKHFPGLSCNPLHHKFIIAKDNSGLIYCSEPVQYDRPLHKEIAKAYGIAKEDALGGGHIETSFEKPGVLKLHGSSGLGSVPKDVFDMFSLDNLLEQYKKIIPSVLTFCIDLPTLEETKNFYIGYIKETGNPDLMKEWEEENAKWMPFLKM